MERVEKLLSEEEVDKRIADLGTDKQGLRRKERTPYMCP